MVANPLSDLLGPVRSGTDAGSDPTLPVETPAAAAEQELPEELGGEPVTYDEPDRYDDYTSSWQNDYADAVGISRYKEL